VAAALTITPASGAITAKATICRIDVTGASSNRAPANTGGEYRQYIRCALSGTDSMFSVRFTPSQAGKWTWDNLIFPAAGTWTVTLRDDTGDSQVATLSVTVS
jgi:hypothetical protein